ncbi:helix-turn-helix transcriptional regulator [Micromonospora narathiwatensis]|uniref:Poly-beta-hydroxybutyrate-responsive repressor n=1 Tax=Micromonospora narathiwatensis TaxID=299146 RepID=A0A1A8ZGJ1_9ACTN|nr:helix-turn-helix transcriptional regulator [Micromonospora narathiwatensis]SBT42991.1 poly-beta-hydroxybutyrate-responsive repressor [Micromonospora narathiwatensis]
MPGRELRGLLHPFLLLLIFERPGHGYDLIERLETMGVSDVEPGHVYRVLRGLERDRSVISAWETDGAGPARRCYTLTAQGHDDLRSWVTHLTYLNQVVDACVRRSADAFERAAGVGRRDPYAVRG